MTTRRRVVLLGATGSIGRQACDVIARFPDRFELIGAVAGSDGAGLAAIATRFGVTRTALVHGDAGTAAPPGCAIGMDAACEIAAMEADVVCVAITGAAAIRPTLTASGGPFLRRPLDTFGSITRAEALAHPTWNMGPKVTIDSATMMNKGLEVIEAHFLFDVTYAAIGVAIHPTSIVHSWVEFRDGAIVAQMG